MAQCGTMEYIRSHATVYIHIYTYHHTRGWTHSYFIMETFLLNSQFYAHLITYKYVCYNYISLVEISRWTWLFWTRNVIENCSIVISFRSDVIECLVGVWFILGATLGTAQCICSSQTIHLFIFVIIYSFEYHFQC